MYAKIENGTLNPAPHRIILSGMQIFNPSEDHLTQAGYKPVTETPMPEGLAPDGQYYEKTYTDTGNTITQSWELVEDKTEPTGKTIEQRVTTLEQNVSEIGTAIERGLSV